MSASGSHIVLGVDESPGSDVALRWALVEARLRNVPLRLVSAYPLVVTYDAIPSVGNMSESGTALVRRVAEQQLAETTRRANELESSVVIESRAVDGRPAAVLAEESEHAALLVVGTRRLHALGSSVLGSVSTHLAARTSCPIVVVRETSEPESENAAVVVGVDATSGSEEVLAFGFDYASRHQTPLWAVLCWHPSLLRNEDPTDRDLAEVWLAECLAGWREQYPDVLVEPMLISGHAVEHLVAQSTGQRLLVVGSHSRHALAGTLLGSVSQGVLHHARCSVAVVPLAG